MSDNNSFEEKNALRKRMHLARNKLPAPLRAQAAEQAATHVMQWLKAQQLHDVALYASCRTELGTGPLLDGLWRTGVQVALPRCEVQRRALDFYYVKQWEQLVPGAYDILEPAPELTEACREEWLAQVVFVPGLAFDRMGGRMGYGGGYYDRLYERLSAVAAARRTRVYWIGLGYSSQLVEEVPRQAHDLVLDAVVTETGFLYRSL